MRLTAMRIGSVGTIGLPLECNSTRRALHAHTTAMRRATYWLLGCHHYYALLMGLLRFRYDYRSGRAYTTRAVTLYSVAVNALFVASLPWLYDVHMRLLQHTETPQLLQVVYIYMRLLRVLLVLITVLFSWLKRDEIVAVISDFYRLQRRYLGLFELPRRLKRRFERRIVSNVLSGMAVDALQLFVTLEVLDGASDWRMLLGITASTLLSNMLYVVMSQYYFAVQSVIMYAHMLDAQLADIMQAAGEVTRASRGQLRAAHFARRCRMLAGELDELAAVHALLQRLAQRINAMFEIQGGCVVLNVCAYNVCIIYMGYTFVRCHRFVMSLSVWGVVALGVSLVLYYLDLREFLAAILELLRVFRNAGVLLERHLPLWPLDDKLERSLNDFNLQLAQNPLHMKLLGLFYFNNEMAYSMFVSAISNSVIIMQYDYKNY